jgi:hypothetical protein
MAVHYRLCDEHPAIRARQVRLEERTCRHVDASARRARKRPVIRIPVVVHVVYEDERDDLSMAQIRSQLRVLNQDFRCRNRDTSKVPTSWKGIAADARIEFALARRDPKGKPTNGVTRTHTSAFGFSTNDDVKYASRGGANPWPTRDYLNIWVCELSGGLLGYAQFPGGPARTDGVVILNTAFGTEGTARAPFNRGRTTTHEVGHWLNLRHIWGDVNGCSGSDLVIDTPNQKMPNYGKPRFPHVSCNNGPEGDMFMNYMDYVDDAAMFLFTLGQVARMEATLVGPRSRLGRSRRSIL